MRAAAAALLAAALCAAPGAAPDAAAQEEELLVSARLLQDEVLLGADAVIELTIENRSATAREVPRLRLASDSVTVAVRGEGIRDASVTRLYGEFQPDAGALALQTSPSRRVRIAGEGELVARLSIPAVAVGNLELTPSVRIDDELTLTAAPLALSVGTSATVRRLLVDVETSRQTFTIELDGAQAYNAVAHVWRLVNEGFYTNLPFHRVVPDLLVQTGDNRGDGTGGPGFFLPIEASTTPFQRGSVGLARGEHRDSSGAQWFVVSTPPGGEVSQAAFAGGFTALGRVVEGMEAVDVLAQVVLRPGTHEPIQPDRVVRTTPRLK